MSYSRLLVPTLLLYGGMTGSIQAQTRVHNRNAYDVWIATGEYRENFFPLGPKGPAHVAESKGWLRIPADGSTLIEATHLLAVTRRVDGVVMPLDPRRGVRDVPRVFYFKDPPNTFHRLFGDGPLLSGQIKAVGGQPREYAPLSWFVNPRTGNHEIAGPDLPAVTERSVIGLYNAADFPQIIRFRWDSSLDWTRFTLNPGTTRILENGEPGRPEIEYDCSPAPGFQLRQRRLEGTPILLLAGKEAAWRDAQRYVFVSRGAESFLRAHLAADLPPVGKDRSDGLDGFFVELQPREERTYRIDFAKGRPARVSVRGLGLTDVDLFVFQGGKEIQRDDRPGDRCDVKWTPAASGAYLVKVQNLDFTKSNRILIEHSGTAEAGGGKISFLPGKGDAKGGKTTAVTLNFNQVVNVPPMREFTLNIALQADKEVTISATGQGTTRIEMAIFSPDGRVLGADNAAPDQCQISFTPPVGGQYRIRLRNFGPLLNQVRVLAK